MEKNLESEISLENIDTNKLAEEIKKVASEAKNEEELKIGVVKILDPIIRKWNIPSPSYEHRTIISGARKDALYGHVIIEFKAPRKLDNKNEFERAKGQIKKYIEEEAVDQRFFGRWFGVIIDGYNIAFIRFRRNKWEEPDKPLDINKETIKILLRAIRGLRLKAIDPEALVRDFGPGELSKKVIYQLYISLLKSKSKRTSMLFDDWKRVFSQVCAYSPEKLSALIEYYGLTDYKVVDVEKLMFAIHTYYTLLMKFITSEVISYFNPMFGSFLEKIEIAYQRGLDEMKRELEDLEEGGIIAKFGIRNLLEADYFAWYLDEWNEEIAEAIISIVERLKEYDPGTSELYPEKVKDLFKRLYQNLVPKKVRHDLGEYFTPDWLAELLLDEVGYDGNPEKRILDPACGSGTFLVLAINRIKEWAEKEFYPDKKELLRKIINNVIGIDLNPLAVLASRANYILALGELNRLLPGQNIDIPVYLADSILVSRKPTLYGEWEVYLKTTVGEFWIPHEIIDKRLLPKVLALIETGIRGGYNKEEFNNLLKIELKGLKETSIDSLTRLFMFVRKLEREGKNKIWTRLLKNSFAPLLIGKFDFVVGNPPWVNWESLPEKYREDTKKLWDSYGLLEKTKGMGLGKVKRDMAMLFTVRCLDRYVKDKGKLAFLIPFTVYKTQAGAGFRKFLANGINKEDKKICCKVLKIHDLVTLYPFEGAINRTSLIVIEKDGKTLFPIPCVMWHNPRSKGIEQEAELEEVKKTTKQFDMIFLPIKKEEPETPWMMITEKVKKAIENIVGESPWYRAYEGINTALNAVYWIDILSKQQNGLLIVPTKVGGQKKKVKEIKIILKPDLIYPLIRGRNVKRWFIEPHSNYIILPTNENGETLEHSELKVKYPKEYEYFLNFFKDLINRSGEPYKSKLAPYRKKPINSAEKEAPPFYWLFNVSPSLANYKVVWKRIAGGITGKAVSFASAVIEPVKDKYLEDFKPVVVNDSLILIPFDKKEEAYYVSGVLNSTPVLFTIASYTYELRMETHITQYIKIPRFNPKNEVHLRISELSKKAHEIAKKIYEENREDLKEKLKDVEEEIDETVAKLYGITNDELKEIKECLMILKEGELEEEETEDEETILPKPKEIEVRIDPLFIEENKSKELKLTIKNNSAQTLYDVKIDVLIDSELLISKSVKRIDKESSEVIVFALPKLKSGEYEVKILLNIGGITTEEKRKLFVGHEKRERKVKSILDEEIKSVLKK